MNNSHNAIIDIVGATCTSCSIAVEHMGQKLKGVHDIWVDRAESKIHINYDGDRKPLEDICAFIHQIGYQANIVQEK